MTLLSRWIVPTALAAGLGLGAIAAPAPAQAQDQLTRVLVDVADVVLRGGTPYYRHGNYGHDDRLVVSRDRYGRPVYYRTAPRHVNSRSGPPYGNAYGYYRNGPGSRDMKCNKKGKCKVEYYDPRYDREGRRQQHVRYDRRGDRYWDGRRWRDRD
ncbi:MAG: hypothetical protein ACR2J7_06910 [Luteimonas sp.]